MSMAALASPIHERSLASWKTWWDNDLVGDVAKAIRDHVDVRKLPGGGQLLLFASFNADSMKDAHTANVAESMLLTYPSDKQPSAYMLGDAVLELDKSWSGGLLGGPQDNPIKEKTRRDAALGEGQKLKKLLSYVRTSALKTEFGRSPEVTYLKSLANKRLVNRRLSFASSSSRSSSPATPSTLAATTLILGQLV